MVAGNSKIVVKNSSFTNEISRRIISEPDDLVEDYKDTKIGVFSQMCSRQQMKNNNDLNDVNFVVKEQHSIDAEYSEDEFDH